MLINLIAEKLDSSGVCGAFWKKLDVGEDATIGLASSARALFVAARFAHSPQPTLVVLPGEDAAFGFSRALAMYLGDECVLQFAERLDVPYDGDNPSAQIVANRLRAAHLLAQGEHIVVVASARSLARRLPPVSAHAADPIVLFVGSELADMPCAKGVQTIAELRAALVQAGYVDTDTLEGPGTFAAHGDVIDVFPGNLDFPVRLDFFGDELEEIRRIMPSTGQTIANLTSVEIYPVTEFQPSAAELRHASRELEKAALTNRAIREVYEKLEGGVLFAGADVIAPYVYKKQATLGDYLGKNALVCMIEPRGIFDDAARAFEQASAAADGSGFPAEGLYASPVELSFGRAVRATYVSIMQSGVTLDAEVPVKRTDVAGAPEKLYAKMRGWVEANYTCVFSCPDFRARQDFELAFVDNTLAINTLDLSAQNDEAAPDAKNGKTAALLRKVVNVVDAPIPLGMVVPGAKLALVSVDDLKSKKSQGSDARRTIDITQITFPYKPGDYVVHSSYGIGLFKDIVRRELDGEMRDYLELDYAEGDKLFLPVEQFDKVTKYVGPEGQVPKITRLDSTDWSRAVAKARKATKKLAFDLVDIYARRAMAKGHRFNVRTPWMRQMEESFPYKETPDQAAAIADVLTDMQSAHPMDRLICGDVGFGKTEVALRAAFAAAQDGRQVMVLCPTTILAQQHYTNFVERFRPFGMRVEILSRFRTPAQQKAALEGFAKGEVAVLIGTHRLLSRDVNPHDLGLVIIDEEQRFGVGHKEQFKNMRESIDVLTLSATPIPRTLQMSISGVRDMSLILTPPDSRKPVKVHVGEWDVDIVSGAIRNEVARGGQVYYVSNRVRTIDDAVARVVEAAPEARVGVAHGKMSKEALEHVMEDFAAGELDVLVATTIIESGIDNPHTNTLIIEDSQRLGLSQMYQLKGRVGRSSAQAYAYFMFPPDMPLTDDARERLLALADNQDLGSGMRVAMRDLEIRGAGNLVGAEQSGNVSAVGFDLFAQMLNNAVVEARVSIAGGKNNSQVGGDAAEGAQSGSAGGGVSGATRVDLSDININIPGSAYLSQEYIERIDERVLWYRRIASIYTDAQADDFEAQIEQEYGTMPPEARALFDKARLKALASEHNIASLTVAAGKLTVEPLVLDRSKLPDLKRAGGRYLADKHKVIMPMKYFGERDLPAGVDPGTVGDDGIVLTPAQIEAKERAVKRREARRARSQERGSGQAASAGFRASRIAKSGDSFTTATSTQTVNETASEGSASSSANESRKTLTAKIVEFLSGLVE